MAPQSTDILFKPLRESPITLVNRLAMARMTRCLATDEVHDSRPVAYHARRARSGTGLFIIEDSPPPTPRGAGSSQGAPRRNEAALAKWKDIANAVNATGSHMVVKLWHAGVLRDAAGSAHATSFRSARRAFSRLQTGTAPAERRSTSSDG